MADDDDTDGNGNGGGDGGNMTLFDVRDVSECIASLKYDNAQGMAIFTFVKGPAKTYRAPISRQQAVAWAHSDSLGEYFNENIKGKFDVGSF